MNRVFDTILGHMTEADGRKGDLLFGMEKITKPSYIYLALHWKIESYTDCSFWGTFGFAKNNNNWVELL